MAVSQYGLGPVEAASGADARLLALVEQLTERLQQGVDIDLESLVRSNPQYANELRRFVPAIEALVGFGCDQPPPNATGETPECELPTRLLGDFRIVCEIGRGGMGVVYEARQLSLDRRVALKVLPFAGMLDPRQLQRFKNEAQAAAQLQHPHIVPVYAVGFERGVHYYAMQYIDGQTLADVIDDLRTATGRSRVEEHQSRHPAPRGEQGPRSSTGLIVGLSTSRATHGTEFHRTVARWGGQIARALQHAHERGIFHRDVKPGNLLLDERGDLWIADFGLAQMEAGARLTGTGDLPGTLRYMSPEQALGKRPLVDHRTDIYSLGATLYELLVLEPVFSGRDRQELLREIAFDEPWALRRRDPAIPADLETIVLKALEKQPADRYVSADELADDLQRFVDDQPIEARRPNLRERSGRWLRRHKPLAASGLALLLLSVVVLAASTIWIARERDLARTAAANERAAARVAQEERERAERNVSLAMQALDAVYLRVAGDRFPRDPVRAKEDRGLLAEALTFFAAFA
ncbi:MAG TPA: serine/threonine-protein kinase, partial [Pirellulales bacterium]|nr:serine/threonine-protein kinase [Pirellulales bacterium]